MPDAPETQPADEMPPFVERLGMYIFRINRFPQRWGLPGEGQDEQGLRRRLFRFDLKRLTRMVDRAEHIIRCLIIWKAWRVLRDGGVTPYAGRMPSLPTGPFERRPVAPKHPLFTPRALPLFEPKPPPFRISLPEPEGDTCARPGASARTPTPADSRPARRYGRARNDDILRDESLYLRIERLDKLADTLEKRAARLAARWSGWLAAADEDKAEPPAEPEGSPRALEDFVFRPPRHLLRPLKSHDPPPDMTDHAEPDEADDLTALHDAAIRAAELFEQRCG
ncbi:MAG: hypothetical protein CMK06_02200 [Ponticaulis sp.]|nr:hypothetical protein [Ponticaulis sp.]